MTATTWEQGLGLLLTSEQVDEAVRAQPLIRLRDKQGQQWFPAFQFRDGQPLEPLIAAYAIVLRSAVRLAR